MNNIAITDEKIDQFVEELHAQGGLGSDLVFDEPRRNLLKSWDDTQAVPGSGKTTILAAKLLLLAKEWPHRHKGICVLTHTNVACDEIRERLMRHPVGHHFNAYPHFVGTIQEFVNRFLALPLLRSEGATSFRIDDDACATTMNKMIAYGTRAYLEKKEAKIGDLRLHPKTGIAVIPAFPNPSTSDSYKDLQNVLSRRLSDGLFCFSEMYFFAKRALAANPQLAETLRQRFPIVFMDEMQDTQDFQDELLSGIFSHNTVKFQRVGDPDQAIYDDMGDGGANQSFNARADLPVIKTTHRFCGDVSRKIQGVSLKQVGEINSLANPDPAPPQRHTVFVFDDASMDRPLEAYSMLVAELDPASNWRKVKAIGATEGAGKFITAYWADYNAANSVRARKPKSLIEAISLSSVDHDPHFSPRYNLIIQTVVDLMRISGTRDQANANKFFSPTTLLAKLKRDGKIVQFRALIASWLLNPQMQADAWQQQVTSLRQLVGITANDAATTAFLAFQNVAPPQQGQGQQPGNKYLAANGRLIDVGTIHSIKGETHDATLVLETKNYNFDVSFLLDNLALIDIQPITAVRKQKAARLLYVGMSRPRHLLCLTVHKDRITDAQRAALTNLGWKIQNVFD